MTDKQKFPVAALLGKGEENAIPSRRLLAMSGLGNNRSLRIEIEKERAAGALILSTCRGRGGYFLPVNDGEEGKREIERYVATLTARASSTFRTLKTARAALGGDPDQFTIEAMLGDVGGVDDG